jgi:hypothetical protein
MRRSLEPEPDFSLLHQVEAGVGHDGREFPTLPWDLDVEGALRIPECARARLEWLVRQSDRRLGELERRALDAAIDEAKSLVEHVSIETYMISMRPPDIDPEADRALIARVEGIRRERRGLSATSRRLSRRWRRSVALALEAIREALGKLRAGLRLPAGPGDAAREARDSGSLDRSPMAAVQAAGGQCALHVPRL